MYKKEFNNDFNFIIDLLKKRLGITNAIIRQLEGDELKTLAFFGYNEKEANLKIFLGQGVSGLCAQENRTILIQDLEIYSGEYLAGINSAQSELCIPLVFRNSVIGTFNIESTEKNNFTIDKIELIHKLAKMLVYSIAEPENETGRNLARTMAMLEQ